MFLWVENSCVSEGATTGDLGFIPALLFPALARPAQECHFTFRLIVSNNFSSDWLSPYHVPGTLLRFFTFHLHDSPRTGTVVTPFYKGKGQAHRGRSNFAQDNTGGNVLAKSRSPNE